MIIQWRRSLKYIADTGNSRIARIDDVIGTGWIMYGPASGQPGYTIPNGIYVSQ